MSDRAFEPIGGGGTPEAGNVSDLAVALGFVTEFNENAQIFEAAVFLLLMAMGSMPSVSDSVSDILARPEDIAEKASAYPGGDYEYYEEYQEAKEHPLVQLETRIEALEAALAGEGIIAPSAGGGLQPGSGSHDKPNTIQERERIRADLDNLKEDVRPLKVVPTDLSNLQSTVTDLQGGVMALSLDADKLDSLWKLVRLLEVQINQLKSQANPYGADNPRFMRPEDMGY